MLGLPKWLMLFGGLLIPAPLATATAAATGLGAGAASCVDNDQDGFCSDVDCNDARSSCTTDCSSDLDGDLAIDCLDLCSDRDRDNFGVQRGAVVVGGGTIAVGGCTTNGTTACPFQDSACTGSDCNDAATSCTTSCADFVDFDGAADCLDLCNDADEDNYGTSRFSVVEGAGAATVGNCTKGGGLPCTYQDGLCAGADCNDAASSCTTSCAGDADADGVVDCLDLCGDADEDEFGVTRSAVTVGAGSVAVGSCTTDGQVACTFGDATCQDTDCLDTASSCTTDCSTDDDQDGVSDCFDLCSDGDHDDYGDDASLDVIGLDAAPVGQCTSDGLLACAWGDPLCLGADECLGNDASGNQDSDAYCADLDCDDTTPGTCELFSDDFETGSVDLWSESEPVPP
jgi:hypothetical protein